MVKLLGRDRKLGVAEGKHRYDLPLGQDVGTLFLLILIALMSFLASMALSGYMALGGATESWREGIENRMTIEIPAEDSGGALLTQEQIESLAAQTKAAILGLGPVKSAEIMTETEVQDLIRPWFGQDVPLGDIALPSLISVEIQGDREEAFQTLQTAAAKISPAIHVDAHESWLHDLLRLTGALQFSAGFIALVIGMTTIVAIAGAVRTRMEMHKSDVELLHLMGASDSYITRQFQRHALTMAFKGTAAGIAMAFAALLVFYIIQSGWEGALLPSMRLGGGHMLLLLLLCPLLSFLAGQVARHTILRALARMP